jgi:hypothetical protein
MTRVPDQLTYGISFTYPTKADAEANARKGGSAFLIAKAMEGVVGPNGGPSFLIYAVTNYHVAWGGFPVLRLHTSDGKVHVIELQKSDWVPHPAGDDIAVAFLSDRIGKSLIGVVKYIPTTDFVTKGIIDSDNIGFGDDVFMIGRFLNHQGTKDTLTPAVRLGNISMMPQPIWNQVTNSDQESFAVEMRSRTGFSGSPVAVYRDGQTRPGNKGPQRWWWLLGINWGYVIEKDTGENTWLNGVLPAWKILEVLEEPALADKHEAGAKWWRERQESAATVSVAAPVEPAPPSNDANPNHRGDFMRLVNAAARKPARED